MLVDIPQNGNDLQTYAQNFTQNYIIAQGIIGEISHVDSDKVNDYHTAFNTGPTKVNMNVPVDMNNKKMLNILVDEAIDNSAATVKLVKDVDTKLYPYTNNQVYRDSFEHFYDSREVSSLNLISQVSGVVINKINPNVFLGTNRNTKDYNSKYGLTFSSKSHILTDIISKNTAFTIFISFVHDEKKNHVKYHGVTLFLTGQGKQRHNLLQILKTNSYFYG